MGKEEFRVRWARKKEGASQMADDNPYKVVVEALARQTVAIGQLAKEIKVEFAQYQNAVQSRDNARAKKIADAINARTARLVEASDALAASVPDAEVGGGPAEPPSTPDQGLPGDQPGIDNTLPGRDRPTDPDFGIDEGGRPVAPGGPIRPGTGRPDQGLPPGPGRPDTGPVRPGRPTDPDFGIEEGGTPDNTLPGQGGDVPDRPEQGLPPRPGNRPPGSRPDRPDQGLPDGEGEAGNPLPDEPAPTLDYLAPSTAKVGEEIIFTVSGSNFSAEAQASIDGEPAQKTTYVNVNQVRVTETFSSAGDKQVTVDGSEPLTITVS